ncbi:MAG: hypothetical protein FWH06_07760 [Oscillospiraceae bacterium]|nr:hypothetical protein [Oscillospiraceae bacterium]
MELRKTIIVFVAICLLALSACDTGMFIVGIEITDYPHKLLYIISMDSGLDLEGGMVRFHHKSAPPSEPFRMDRSHGVDVRHDIDFTKEGIYAVTLFRHEEAQATFPIQVVSLETLESIVEASRE